MDEARTCAGPAEPAVLEVSEPRNWSVPVVYASPHSGTWYPPGFVAAAALDANTLRRSEDSFVDRLFQAAPRFGSPLVNCNFARVYLDVNREPYELDPAMFEDSLPPEANTTSLRVAGGLGTIPRVVADGAEVYRGKLRFEEAQRRVQEVYLPYHDVLGRLIQAARDRFGFAVLVDCHSMPSSGGEREDPRRRADIVLGDRYGTTAARRLVDTVGRAFAEEGLKVVRNNPYAGGFSTYHYGRPLERVHALQIEINRALYMDEQRIVANAGFAAIRAACTRVVATLAGTDLKAMLHPG